MAEDIEKWNVAIDSLDLGENVVSLNVYWEHLFVETEDYVFLLIQRTGLFAKWFGKFKVKHVLDKKGGSDARDQI